MPGRRITKVPAKPMRIADQRGPTFSPRNSMANKVAKIGAKTERGELGRASRSRQ